jgi:hypothetical protein
VCHIDPLDPDTAYATSYPGTFPSVYRSTTGLFGDYDVITDGHGISAGDNSNWVTPYLVHPTSPNILYLGTQRMYRSVNYGSSWTPQGPSDMSVGDGATLVSLEINRNFPTVVYAGTENGRVWRTENSGTVWSDISAGLPSRSVNDLASDPGETDRAFAVLGGFNVAHVWEWNRGTGWVARGGGLPNIPANAILMLSPNDILVGTDVGVFRSTDGAVTFEPFMDGLPLGAVVTDLKFNAPDLVTAGTYGRGAWQVHVDAVAAMVSYDSLAPLIEDDGDGDNKIEPGETWRVQPRLRNLGGQTALGVTARLATATPGVTIVEPAVGQYGDMAAGVTAGPATPLRFAVHPDFPCGNTITFDVLDISSTNAPGDHGDALSAFSVQVLDHDFGGGGGAAALMNETFDGGPAADFREQLVGAGVRSGLDPSPIAASRLVKDGEPRGASYRFGGKGAETRGRQLWLHHGGTDSRGGTGMVIPREAQGVHLTLVHRYATGSGAGRVVIDAVADGRDDYTALRTVDPRPHRTAVFQGTSDGWVTSTFDLTRYRGRRVHLAFVYEGGTEVAEGWTLDQVQVATLGPAAPVCHVTEWPASVPPTAIFRLVGADVEASWAPSCNVADIGQSYSIHAGDLDLLQATGTFTHAPVDGACGLTSPATFTPGAGNQYYLVVPNVEGREGGHGAQSSGVARPQPSVVCGERREAVCE